MPAPMCKFQSTRPHGARQSQQASPTDYGVSIHAPARGATAFWQRPIHQWAVSIHAPARGATRSSRSSNQTCFNPRARTGATTARLIQAPAPCFNPRARTGATSGVTLSARYGNGFNPRARTGRDGAHAAVHHCSSFNPRARTGRDLERQIAIARHIVSIHAPARGATATKGSGMCCMRFQSTRPHGARLTSSSARRAVQHVSIHAPARGATQDPLQVQKVMLRFNPRARTGATALQQRAFLSCLWFQSTRPHGARPPRSRRSAQKRHVSIHAPARGDQFRPLEIGLEIVSIHAPARGAT